MLNLATSDAYILQSLSQAEVSDQSVWQRQAPDPLQSASAHLGPYL